MVTSNKPIVNSKEGFWLDWNVAIKAIETDGQLTSWESLYIVAWKYWWCCHDDSNKHLPITRNIIHRLRYEARLSLDRNVVLMITKTEDRLTLCKWMWIAVWNHVGKRSAPHRCPKNTQKIAVAPPTSFATLPITLHHGLREDRQRAPYAMQVAPWWVQLRGRTMAAFRPMCTVGRCA